MIFNSAIDMIGNTPIIKLNTKEGKARVYVKLERYNPGGSVKDRAALGMIEEAERIGYLKEGNTIVEPTSGNTGIALAMIGRLKGYRVIIVMPETMSIERRNIIKAYGAELILTEGAKGMKGAISKAKELSEENEGYFVPQQFVNIANPNKHYKTTAEEILKDVPNIDVFMTGVGTGGTISGVGKLLKESKSNVEVIAIEPEKSPVISGGEPGPHKIQGIGAGFIPDIYNKDVVDKVLTISDEDAFEGARIMARDYGILVGISSGANIIAALRKAETLGEDKTIVTVAPDGGEKYLSMGLYE
ncbi:cysteine synthase A [Clostridium hydrogeniformans]|uniref:cysteine synthase A n=1 Tax=Clostridium hydrogeniformans TaxID=349933 RepID=UPI000486944C|nr:cysteine synthase A [Clostridium hydrogeniformans]